MPRAYLYVERHIGLVFHKHFYTVQCRWIYDKSAMHGHCNTTRASKYHLIIKMSDVIDSFLFSLYAYGRSIQKQLISEK